MTELLDSKEIHSIESRMIALLDRTFLKSTKLDSVDYKKELPKNVKRWFSSKTFEIQLDNLITELIKFSLLYADSQMKILTAAKVEEGTILTKEAIARATDISETASKSIIRMLEDDAIYYEGPAKLGRRIEDLWGGQRHKAVSFAHTFSADVATATTVYRYRQYGVQFMEFSAKIDERTTPQCRALHQVVFDLSKDSVDRYRPPLHHRCRSALLPIPNTRPPSEDMIFENRDFSGTLDSPEDVDKVFQNIEKFNDKYRVSGFVIDKDLSTRIMLEKGVSVGIELPTIDKTLIKTFVPSIDAEAIRLKVLKADAKFYEKRGKLFDEKWNIKEENNVLFAKRESKFSDLEKARFGTVEREWIEKDIEELQDIVNANLDKIAKINKKIDKLDERKLDEIRKSLYIRDTQETRALYGYEYKDPDTGIMYHIEPDKKFIQKEREALDFVSRVTAEDKYNAAFGVAREITQDEASAELRIIIMPDGFRAHAEKKWGIYMASDDNVSTAMSASASALDGV